MLVNARRYPIAYPAGTVIDSEQTRCIRSTVVQCELAVGNSFMVPEHMEKVILTEGVGGVVLERYFLSLPTLTERCLIPIFVKVYDQDNSPILVFRQGIEHARHLLTGKLDKLSFLKDFVFQCTMSEIDCLDHTLYDVLVSCFDAPGLNTDISNDATSLLNKGGAQRTLGYPWDTTAFISSPVRAILEESIENTPKRVASDVHDLFLSVDLYDREDGSWMLYNAVSDYFKTIVGSTYENVAYDPLTLTCSTESEVDGKTIVRKAGSLWPRPMAVSTINRKQCEMVTVFSSNLLQLCVWVHELPLTEFGFTYTLPLRGSLEKLTWHYAKTYKSCTILNKQEIQLQLAQITRFWNNDQFQQVGLYKTSADELLIVLSGSGGERRLYVDLTISTLVSQSLTRVV